MTDYGLLHYIYCSRDFFILKFLISYKYIHGDKPNFQHLILTYDETVSKSTVALLVRSKSVIGSQLSQDKGCLVNLLFPRFGGAGLANFGR